MSAVSEQDCRRLSNALRQGIVDYEFRPTEVLALLILCEETFDKDQIRGRVDLVGWSRRMGMEVHKFSRKIWEELVKCGVIDYNSAQGTYELRPDLAMSRMRSLRVRKPLRADPELPLVAERPLSESLSETSRESVLRAGKAAKEDVGGAAAPSGIGSQAIDYRAEFQRLQAAIARGTVAEEFPETATADYSAAAKPPDPADLSAVPLTPESRAVTQTADYSAAIASLASTSKAKLAKADKSAAALRWLQEIDRTEGALRSERFAPQWEELCQRDPDYVLNKLRGALEAALKREKASGGTVESPMAYMSKKAREDGMFRRIQAR